MANEQKKKKRNKSIKKKYGHEIKCIVFFSPSFSYSFYIFVISFENFCLHVFKVDHYSRLCRKHVYNVLCIVRLANESV